MEPHRHPELVASIDRVVKLINNEKSGKRDLDPAFQGAADALVMIRNDLRSDSPNYERDANLAGGIGRLRMEDMNQAESPLGQEILAVTNEVYRLEERT